MGLEMACARIGTALALSITPLLAEEFGSVSMPILLGLLLLCIGMISFVVFVVMDTKRDRELKDSAEPEEPFRFRDIFEIVRIKGFWYIAILCVLFYSAVFPFLKYAPDLMFNKFGISEKLSGIIPHCCRSGRSCSRLSSETSTTVGVKGRRLCWWGRS